MQQSYISFLKITITPIKEYVAWAGKDHARNEHIQCILHCLLGIIISISTQSYSVNIIILNLYIRN